MTFTIVEKPQTFHNGKSRVDGVANALLKLEDGKAIEVQLDSDEKFVNWQSLLRKKLAMTLHMRYNRETNIVTIWR